MLEKLNFQTRTVNRWTSSNDKCGLIDTYPFLLGIINFGALKNKVINDHSIDFLTEAVKCLIGHTRRWVCSIPIECLDKRVNIGAFCLPFSNVDNDLNVTLVKTCPTTSLLSPCKLFEMIIAFLEIKRLLRSATLKGHFTVGFFCERDLKIEFPANLLSIF